ncbi:IS110 family transposase [Candidatus Palauibacter sp.]|uniref:IS110 family transposase n=1 Tax=Candidatus Palauibacter sp. TaxID=3101350 RepID=UPI003B51BD67
MDERSKVYVGMDVHKDTVMVAVLPEGAPEPTVVKRLPNEPRRLKRWLARVSRQGEIRACYEASGAGYVLERALRDWGHRCEIVAPSLIPRRPGDRRKHDRKDATELARLYRAGELVAIRVPSETEERVRDLVRCREVFQREILKSRHYILKFLARRGLVYREGANWTGRHVTWLRALQRDEALEAEDRLVFGEYLALFDYKLGRREELDRRIEALALEPAYREAVGRLCCLRGISTHAAMVLATEIGDFRRFENPGKLMAYVGLVPSEHSSGASRRQGAITKAGNSRVRHVLVQAAWSYRFPPRRGPALSRRQRGQAPEVVAHSWKAQHRLHKVFTRLAFRKNGQIAAVAVARELAGFVWAIMRDPEETAPARDAKPTMTR